MGYRRVAVLLASCFWGLFGCASREEICKQASNAWTESGALQSDGDGEFTRLCNARSSAEAKCLKNGPFLLTFDEVQSLMSRDESKVAWVKQHISPDYVQGETDIRKKYRVVRDPAPSPTCETTLKDFERSLDDALVGLAKKSAEARRAELQAIDWEKVPAWSGELQLAANGGDKETCPAADELRAQVDSAKDEFERAEKETAEKKAREDCLRAVEAQNHTLPQRVRVEFQVTLDGEFDFNKLVFRLKLVTVGEEDCFKEDTGGPRRCPPVGGVRELQPKDGTEKTLAILVSPFGPVGKGERLPYYSGLAVVPLPDNVFSGSRNVIRFPVPSVDEAKKLKGALASGATAQLLLEPGSPNEGTGLSVQDGEGGAAAFLAKPLAGVRARPIALRLVVAGKTVGGPVDLRR